MKKKTFVFVSLLAILVMLSPRLYILTTATWQYFHTNTICYGKDPTPPRDLGDQFPVTLLEVKPFSVKTDKGYMYSGDEYEVVGEGYWYGIVTLLWAGKKGAFFVVTFPSNDVRKGYSRMDCKWYTPVGNYQ